MLLGEIGSASPTRRNWPPSGGTASTAHLAAGEEAAPFTALTHVDATGEPFIAGWVKEQGVEPWARRLLEVTVPPVLHFLVAHGIALEAHAQNLILIHDGGRPRRLALRDFHDGIRFSADRAGRPRRPAAAAGRPRRSTSGSTATPTSRRRATTRSATSSTTASSS